MLPLSRSSGLHVVAHRGASADYVENTTAAFEAAIAANVSGIELDLQLSRDGEAVVFHDRTLERVGRPCDRVRDLTLAELRGLPITDDGEPASMLTLDEVLDSFLSRTALLLEIKARERDRCDGEHFRLAEIVADRLAERGGIDRAMILSFDAACLCHAKARRPGIRTALIARRPWRLTPDETLAHDALSVVVEQLTPAVVECAAATDTPLMTYTVNDEDAVVRAESAGVQVMMTDRPAWLVGRFAEGGK